MARDERRWMLFTAILLSSIINAFLVWALVKTDFLKGFYTDENPLTAFISKEMTQRTDSQKKEEEVLADNLIEPTDQEVVQDTVDLSNNTVDLDVQEQKPLEDKPKAETLPAVRLELPPIHRDLFKISHYQVPDVEGREGLSDTESTKLVLLKHNSERLTYDIYWVGVYVGWAQLKAERRLTDVTITSEVHSSKFISNFYRVEDYAKSVVLGGRPHNFRIKQIEGKYKSDKETIFDYDKGVITFVDYLKNKQTEHPLKEGIYWDVISGFYYLRSMPVIDRDRIFVDVFDSNKFIRVQILILGRETLELQNGKEAETIKAKVVLHSEGLFQKIGDIIVWLSDDVDRIPLKVETKVPVGKVTAELREIVTQ